MNSSGNVIIWFQFSFWLIGLYSNRYAEALGNYEKGMEISTLNSIHLSDTELDEHKRMCEFGIARTNIKLGNFKKGVRKSSRLHRF